MTQRLVDSLEHGVGELLSPIIDGAEATPLAVWTLDLSYGGTRTGQELNEEDSVPLNAQGLSMTSLGSPTNTQGTNLEILESDFKEASGHFSRDPMSISLRPSSTIEDVTIRKVVPGGGG